VTGAQLAESQELQPEEHVICQGVTAVPIGLVVFRDATRRTVIWTAISEETFHCPALEVTFTDKRVFICTFFSLFGTTAPQWARAPSFTRFLDHIKRRTTVGRTPLDE
jgi:hypothetical protein